MKSKNILIGILLIAVAVVFRVKQPIDNFAPVTAIALFAGYLFQNKKQGIAIALLASLVGDIIISYINKYALFHDTFVFVYGSYALIALLGSGLNSGKFKWNKLAVFGLTSSLLFFVFTNFGTWLMGNMYAKDFGGLVNCFVAAVPFYKNSFLSDLIYVPLIFGIYQFATRKSHLLSKEYTSK
jgi:hypothetical protein